jgi:hypothetical protein
VENVQASRCRARAEQPGNHQGDFPTGAKAFLHHWSLGGGPLRVALDAGIERPDTSTSVRIIDQPSEADIVIARRGDYLELDRPRDSYIASTSNVRTLKLPKYTDKVALESILTRIARFHHHLLRGGPGNVRDRTLSSGAGNRRQTSHLQRRSRIWCSCHERYRRSSLSPRHQIWDGHQK